MAGGACWMSHPELKFGDGTLVGGNCAHPDTADVLISLDTGGRPALYDEELGFTNAPVSILYPIKNMQTPKDPVRFYSLCQHILAALKEGKKVHVGCIGGHGRTGLVIAGVAALWGIEDAIDWVRANYCNRAVESRAQEDFLVKVFGCSKPKRTGRRSESVDNLFDGF